VAISIKKLSEKENIIDFGVTLGSSDFEKELSGWYSEKAKVVRIDGFRPGKTPLNLVKTRYADEAQRSILNKLIDQSIRLILKENKIKAASQPKVTVEKASEKDGFECKISYELLPNIILKDFKSIKCEELNLEVGEKEVDDSLANLLERHKSHEKEPGQGASEWHDKVAFLIKEKGATHTPETQEMVLDKEEAGPFADLGKALHAKKANEQLEVEIKFPKNYYDRSVAGKAVVYSVQIQSVHKPIKFKLDNTFAKEFECETVEDLRKKMRDILQGDSNQLLNLYHKRQVLDALDAEYDLVLPQSVVDKEFQFIWDRLQNEMAEAKARGESSEDLDLKATEEEYKNIAKRRVKLGLIISEIAQKHDIKLTKEEIQQAVIREALKYNSQAKEVVEFYSKNAQALEQLTAPLLEDKVANFVLSQATKKSIKIKPEDLQQKLKGIVPGYGDEDDDSVSETEAKTAKKTSTKKKG
jgi:trigger factor